MLFATHRENSLFLNNKLFCSFYKLGRDQLETYQNWSLCFRVPRCAQNKLKCGSYIVVSLAHLQENTLSGGNDRIHWAPPVFETTVWSVSLIKNPQFPDQWRKGGIFWKLLANGKLQLTVEICVNSKRRPFYSDDESMVCVELSFRRLFNL